MNCGHRFMGGAAISVWLALAAGCGGASRGGDAGVGDVQGPDISQEQLKDRSVHREVDGSEDSELTLALKDGSTWRLELPAGALRERETITLTALKGLEGLPLGAGVAVDLAPEGLRLLRPATLRLTLSESAELEPSRAIGFAFHGSGEDFGLRTASRDGKTLALRMDGFTTAGFGMTHCDELKKLFDAPWLTGATLAQHRLAVLAARSDRCNLSSDELATLLAQTFSDWYLGKDGLERLLDRTVAEPASHLANAISQMNLFYDETVNWSRATDDFDPPLSCPPVGTCARAHELFYAAEAKLMQAFQVLVEKLDARCRNTQGDDTELLEWLCLARSLVVEGRYGNELDVDALLVSKSCGITDVRIAPDSAQLVLGKPQELAAQALDASGNLITGRGYSFGWTSNGPLDLTATKPDHADVVGTSEGAASALVLFPAQCSFLSDDASSYLWVDRAKFEIRECAADEDCSDGLACTGIERCDGQHRCVTDHHLGCDDGVACTSDGCLEPDGSCQHLPDNSLCPIGERCVLGEGCRRPPGDADAGVVVPDPCETADCCGSHVLQQNEFCCGDPEAESSWPLKVCSSGQACLTCQPQDPINFCVPEGWDTCCGFVPLEPGAVCCGGIPLEVGEECCEVDEDAGTYTHCPVGYHCAETSSGFVCRQ